MCEYVQEDEKRDELQQNSECKTSTAEVATSTGSRNEGPNVAATTLNVVGNTDLNMFWQTAKVSFYSSVNNNVQVFSRIIMDNVCQRPYITEKFKRGFKFKIPLRRKLKYRGTRK